MLTSTPFENVDEVYAWLSQFFNAEKGLNKRSFCLDNIKILAKMADHPEQCAPSIHVAGSKGKGSVTGMIASILDASGIKTARYTSPHVSNFRERLSLGNTFFSEKCYGETGKKLMELVEAFSRIHKKELSFFELFTLWFFLCARHESCGVMVVETGMGGRLDATNILDPLASVITLIELEHTEYLGTNIAAISSEKAGIIKASKPLILAEQPGEALDVFREQANHNKSPLFYLPDHVELQHIRVDRNGIYFTLILKSIGIDFPDLFVPMPGEIQAKNAALAVLAVKTVFPGIQNESIYQGLARFTLPARFERLTDKPPLVIDGAHTPESITLCLKTFTTLYGGGGVLLFGCAAEKDSRSMAELCFPHFSQIIITTPGTFKKSNPEEIYAAFTSVMKKQDRHSSIDKTFKKLMFIPDTNEAIDYALEAAIERELPVLCTGSFYLAGEIRNRLKP